MKPKLMCLSDAIIYATVAEVQQWLEAGAEVNEIDAYGYTPLIQTAIVDNVKMAELVLKYEAKVDGTDLTGRTALHWAADNNNIELCDVLLKAGANPNAYTKASQPVLVSPVLRDQKKLKQLLYNYGADLNFAQDFINAKLTGHRYELEGYIDILNAKNEFVALDLSGFYLEFTLNIIESSLKRYQRHFSSRALRGYFKYLQPITKALAESSRLMRYQHYLSDEKKQHEHAELLLQHEPVIIPIAYEGHAITLAKYGNLLARCDRGEQGRLEGTVIIYRLNRPAAINPAFIQEIVYKRQTRAFITEELIPSLGVQRLKTLPIQPQITGNCSWANVEAAIPALLYMMQLRDQQVQVNLDTVEKTSIYVYQQWLDWERDVALNEWIERFPDASPARQASIATLLAAVFYQNADYLLHHDLERANKMAPILSHPNYRYILRSYVQAYGHSSKNPRAKAFMDLLDLCGVDTRSV